MSIYGRIYGVNVLFEWINRLCKFVVAIPIVILVNLSEEGVDPLTGGSCYDLAAMIRTLTIPYLIFSTPVLTSLHLCTITSHACQCYPLLT